MSLPCGLRVRGIHLPALRKVELSFSRPPPPGNHPKPQQLGLICRCHFVTDIRRHVELKVRSKPFTFADRPLIFGHYISSTPARPKQLCFYIMTVQYC